MPWKSCGMSLFELLFSLAILAILLSVSLPNFRDFAQSVAGDITLRKLATAIQLGKSAANTSGETVTLCRSIDGNECGGDWQDGILLFTDGNRNRLIDESDALIRYVTFSESGGSIRFRAFQNKQYLQLTYMGTTQNQNGNFTYCPFDGDGQFARQLIVSRTASVRFALDSDGDGYREDSRGRRLACE